MIFAIFIMVFLFIALFGWDYPFVRIPSVLAIIVLFLLARA